MVLSTLATLAVHVALILFLLYRLSDVGPGLARAEGERMTLIDIGDGDAQPQVEQPAADTPTSDDEQQPANEVTAPAAPEWTVAKMRVVHRDEAKSAPATAAAATPAAPKVARGGGSGYDPYAGAAPQWRDPPPVWTARPSTAVSTASTEVRLAPSVIATIRRMFNVAGIGINAPLRLRLTVDAEGRVASVAFAPDITDKTIPPSVALMLRGKRLACFIGAQDCSARSTPASSLDVAV